MGKIRVLHLLTSLAPGGAETNLLALAQFFNREKFEFGLGFGGDGGLKAEFESTGMELIQMWPNGISLSSYLHLRSICEIIEKFSPDIIHAHLDLVNVIAVAAKQRLRCKVILHLHGSGIVPRRHVPGRGPKHWIWDILNKTYRYSDAIIAICSYQLPFLERIGIERSKIVLIPNGITVGNETILAGTIKPGYHFINVARFYKQKGHEVLIRAFHSAIKAQPQIRLTLVGDGPLRADTEKQVERLGLENRVTFAGIRRDVPDLLTTHDCFILSSLWELQPITILEAMRAGLPVIATNVGGVEDTVVDGETGLLVKPGNEESLSNAMIRLASDEQLGPTMGIKGLEIIKSRFSNRIVAEKLESVYEILMEPPK